MITYWPERRWQFIQVIIEDRIDDGNNLDELPCMECSEQETKEQVLEAHKILMGLSDDNKAKFQELVSMLESS